MNIIEDVELKKIMLNEYRVIPSVPALCEIQSNNLVFYDLLCRLVLCMCTTSANISLCQENLFLTLKSHLFYSVECILVLQYLCNMLFK